MALFKRKNKDEQPRTCPECCQIVSAGATECDMCGAQLAPATPEPAGIER